MTKREKTNYMEKVPNVKFDNILTIQKWTRLLGQYSTWLSSWLKPENRGANRWTAPDTKNHFLKAVSMIHCDRPSVRRSLIHLTVASTSVIKVCKGKLFFKIYVFDTSSFSYCLCVCLPLCLCVFVWCLFASLCLFRFFLDNIFSLILCLIWVYHCISIY